MANHGQPAPRRMFLLLDLKELMDPEYVQNNKIGCIKHIRTMTGEGLKEAKDFFEQVWHPFILHGERVENDIEQQQATEVMIQEILTRLSILEQELNAPRTKQRAKGLFNAEY